MNFPNFWGHSVPPEKKTSIRRSPFEVSHGGDSRSRQKPSFGPDVVRIEVKSGQQFGVMLSGGCHEAGGSASEKVLGKRLLTRI